MASDITWHRIDEGKLYCYAIKAMFSNRIIGYNIADRPKSQLVVTALRNRSRP